LTHSPVRAWLFTLEWTHPTKREHALLLTVESVNKVYNYNGHELSCQTIVYC